MITKFERLGYYFICETEGFNFKNEKFIGVIFGGTFKFFDKNGDEIFLPQFITLENGEVILPCELFTYSLDMNTDSTFKVEPNLKYKNQFYNTFEFEINRFGKCLERDGMSDPRDTSKEECFDILKNNVSIFQNLDSKSIHLLSDFIEEVGV